MTKKMIIGIFSCMLLLSQNLFADKPVSNSYHYQFIQHQWLTMPDGVKLSVNYWQPQSKYAGEKFPIVLEVLPYRKDDIHFTGDYAIGSYFARHGIGFARVDIRGTGSSQGITPDREYSDQELEDIQEVIKQLAVLPWSNGKIGMQGISWSAFNSMMTAMQAPTELKGILVAHGSDDIYANDIHNIDGALHLDIFTIEIEVDNILPRSPEYKIDEDYFAHRFNQKPWIFNYLKQQRDSEYWQTNRSLRTDYSAIKIPVYAFASLLDGYRDFAVNMMEQGHAPIKVAIGPQHHAWPDGFPGPHYEWRHEAVKFWQHVLNNQSTDLYQSPPLLVFIRDSVPADVHLQQTPGAYYTTQWPVPQQKNLRFYLQNNRTLDEHKGVKAAHRLSYKPSTGKGVLNWWGETTPDMRQADRNTLLYDSAPIKNDLTILGKPKLSIQVAADAPLAHWIARLEDVAPDGTVAFVTGGLINGAQRESRTDPKVLEKNKFYQLNIPMHFTSWKFAQGHKIRLTIANAQFPMVWPTPHQMTTQIKVGGDNSSLVLPVISLDTLKQASLPKIEANESHQAVKHLEERPLTPFKITEDKDGNINASAEEGYKLAVRDNILEAKYKVLYQVNDNHPANALFVGQGEDTIHVTKEKRLVKVKSTIRIQSDEKYFHVSVIRHVYENDKLLRTKEWQESIARDFQ